MWYHFLKVWADVFCGFNFIFTINTYLISKCWIIGIIFQIQRFQTICRDNSAIWESIVSCFAFVLSSIESNQNKTKVHFFQIWSLIWANLPDLMNSSIVEIIQIWVDLMQFWLKIILPVFFGNRSMWFGKLLKMIVIP